MEEKCCLLAAGLTCFSEAPGRNTLETKMAVLRPFPGPPSLVLSCCGLRKVEMGSFVLLKNSSRTGWRGWRQLPFPLPVLLMSRDLKSLRPRQVSPGTFSHSQPPIQRGGLAADANLRMLPSSLLVNIRAPPIENRFRESERHRLKWAPDQLQASVAQRQD